MLKRTIQFGRSRLAGIQPLSRSPEVYFLLGGGTGKGKEKVGYLARELAAQGVNSFAFDPRGIGESSGRLRDTSLATRVLDAKRVIERSSVGSPAITLWGFSMGGYVAIKLTREVSVRNLILFCPAIYDRRAYTANFGSGFSRILRQKGSWRRSDALEILSRYRGNLVLVIPDQDEIIPRQVSTLIIKAARNCREKTVITLRGCPHHLHPWLKAHPTIRKRIIKVVVSTLGMEA